MSTPLAIENLGLCWDSLDELFDGLTDKFTLPHGIELPHVVFNTPRAHALGQRLFHL